MKTTIKNQRKLQNKTEFFEKKSLKNIALPFQVGEVKTIKIHALGPNNLGLSELSNGYTIIVPKVSLSDEVRVVIEKIFSGKAKYATAKVLEILKTGQNNLNLPSILNETSRSSTKNNLENNKEKQAVIAGEILDVTISKPGPKGSGLVQFSNDYTIVVPKTNQGDRVKIQITRVKNYYAFAKIVDSNSLSNKRNMPLSMKLENRSSGLIFSTNKNNSDHLTSQNSKFHLVLPKTAKCYRGYSLVKLSSYNQKDGYILFIKLGLGAKLGDLVRIQIMKTGSNYAVAKILKVSPLSKTQKQMRTKAQIQKMVQTGMHFGEKAIRCHANMRKYIWYRKKGKNHNRPFLKKDRYYINVLKTRRCLKKALKQLAKYAAKGKTFLFVGTKKSAAALIARTALFTKTSFFVNTRWLGGMLTNWKTILKSISQIKPILKEKQRIIQNILEKRKKIKHRFIKKVNLLRKRSQKLMAKGKILIAKIQQNRNNFIQRSVELLQKKQEILLKNQLFIQKYIELKYKKRELIQQSLRFVQQGTMLAYHKQNLLKQFKKNQTKLTEFKQLFMIGQELVKLKKTANLQGHKILSVSYGKLNEFSEQTGSLSWAVPNPPKEILNRMIQSMKMKYENLNNGEVEQKTDMKSSLLSVQDGLTRNHSKSEQTAADSTIVLSKLLNKFTSFLPFMKIYSENLLLRQQNLQLLLKKTQQNIQTIHTQLKTVKEFFEKVNAKLVLIKTKLLAQQKTLKTLRAKLKRLASEQRLLKFLPRLRYLSTPKIKMAETVQTLMKKFVDPKMTVPMEQIYDDKFKFTSKKIAAARKQKWQRLEKYFGGITKMAKMNKKQISNNIAIIVGQQEEMNAVRECKKLGIKMFTLVDTNCNPKFSNHIIPVNDDSRNSVKFILQEMLTHIRLAQKIRQKIYTRKIRRYPIV